MIEFPDNEGIVRLSEYTIGASVAGFIINFLIKSLQDPNFCRSEKHIETVKKLEMMEQKGDPYPKLITPNTTHLIPNPDKKLLKGGQERE